VRHGSPAWEPILFERTLEDMHSTISAVAHRVQEPVKGMDAAARDPPWTGRTPGCFWSFPPWAALISGILVFFIARKARGAAARCHDRSLSPPRRLYPQHGPMVKICFRSDHRQRAVPPAKKAPSPRSARVLALFFATILKLKPRDRRIRWAGRGAAASGPSFHAPLGAALFAPEVL